MIAFWTSKIFQIKHQRQINAQNQTMINLQNNTATLLKCKKSAVTVLYAYGLLLVCYLPFLVAMVIEAINGLTRPVRMAYEHATTVVLINPIIYC